MKTIIRVYRDDGWRWQMRDTRNGRIIGASTEGYTRQTACLKNLERVTGVTLDGWRTGREVTLKLDRRHWLFT